MAVNFSHLKWNRRSVHVQAQDLRHIAHLTWIFQTRYRSSTYSYNPPSNVLYVNVSHKRVICLFVILLQIYALNKVMTELEQQQFEAFCKQMQSQSEWRLDVMEQKKTAGVQHYSVVEWIECLYNLKWWYTVSTLLGTPAYLCSQPIMSDFNRGILSDTVTAGMRRGSSSSGVSQCCMILEQSDQSIMMMMSLAVFLLMFWISYKARKGSNDWLHTV